MSINCPNAVLFSSNLALHGVYLNLWRSSIALHVLAISHSYIFDHAPALSRLTSQLTPPTDTHTAPPHTHTLTWNSMAGIWWFQATLCSILHTQWVGRRRVGVEVTQKGAVRLDDLWRHEPGQTREGCHRYVSQL